MTDLDAELSIPVWIGWYDCDKRWRCITGPLTTVREFDAKMDSLRTQARRNQVADVSEIHSRDNPRPAWHLIPPG